MQAPTRAQTTRTLSTRKTPVVRIHGLASTRGWLGRWRAVHTQGATIATLAVIGVTSVLAAPDLGIQLVLLTAAVAITALPHGAADHLALRPWLFPKLGRLWLTVFVVTYVGVGVLVLLGWFAAPPVALTLFLALAVLHFGAEDAERASYPRGVRTIALVLRGAIPVLGPVLFHPQETALLFAHLLPGTSPEAVSATVNAMAPGVPWATGAWVGLAVHHLVHGSRRDRMIAVEIATLVLLMAVAPPLIAFGVYFCGWHAVRHMLAEAHALDGARPLRGFRRFVLHALPMSLGAILLGSVAYLTWGTELSVDVGLTRVLFIGLAALTVPHMVVGVLRAGTNP